MNIEREHSKCGRVPNHNSRMRNIKSYHCDVENPNTFLLHHSELKILGNPLQVQVLHPPRVSYVKTSENKGST